MIQYIKDHKYPEYIKTIFMDDITIEFYPIPGKPEIVMKVTNKANKAVYYLENHDVNYQEPWFSDATELERELKENGEEKTREEILETLRYYFSIVDDP